MTTATSDTSRQVSLASGEIAGGAYLISRLFSGGEYSLESFVSFGVGVGFIVDGMQRLARPILEGAREWHKEGQEKVKSILSQLEKKLWSSEKTERKAKMILGIGLGAGAGYALGAVASGALVGAVVGLSVDLFHSSEKIEKSVFRDAFLGTPVREFTVEYSTGEKMKYSSLGAALSEIFSENSPLTSEGKKEGIKYVLNQAFKSNPELLAHLKHHAGKYRNSDELESLVLEVLREPTAARRRDGR